MVKKTVIISYVFILFFLKGNCFLVYVNQSVFKNDETSSFVELYMKIPVNSVKLKMNEGLKFQSELLVTLRYSTKDSIYYQTSYELVSPEFNDTNHLNYAIVDLKRVVLPYGNFRCDLLITDLHDTSKKATYASILNTRFVSNLISFSDVQFADTIFQSKTEDKFTRNKMSIIPNVFNTYHARQNTLYFYAEFYNASNLIPDGLVYLKYYLKKDSVYLYDFQGTTGFKPQQVNFINGKLSIKNLPQGNYRLVMELLDPKNRILAVKSGWFSRFTNDTFNLAAGSASSKEFKSLLASYNLATLTEYLESVRELSDPLEIKTEDQLLATQDSVRMRDFLYEFWIKIHPENPFAEWIVYAKNIEDVNRMFGTSLRKGYLTDRGRVYLQYGPPNSVIESEYSSLAYPYQIWQYYRLTPTQMNKKFVFFNRTGALDEYQLIHSNATGEPQNLNWKEIILKQNLLPGDDNSFGNNLNLDFGE